jgi:hypothetical protein
MLIYHEYTYNSMIFFFLEDVRTAAWAPESKSCRLDRRRPSLNLDLHLETPVLRGLLQSW